MNIRKLTENDAESLWKLRLYALETDPISFGRALLASVVETASALPGMRCLLLTVSATQQAAIKLYQDLGFRSFGTEPHALKVGERSIDEHHMILEFDGRHIRIAS